MKLQQLLLIFKLQYFKCHMLYVVRVVEVTQRIGIYKGHGGWVYNHSSGMKGLQSKFGDAFVCKVCENADDAKDINIQKNMDLGNSV